MIPRKYKEQLYAVGAYSSRLNLKAWVVGGAVRDFYLKRNTLDIDLAFDGNQESVAGFCVKNWGGDKHKFSQFYTFRVNMDNGLKFDMIRTRKEKYVRPGALPSVEPSTIKDDLFRRDFTVNAWSFSINPENFGELYDPFGAEKDIKAGLIRVLHDKSFLDDPTRMYRAVRFAGRFGWKLAPKTEQLIKKAVEGEYPLLLTRSRFCHEFLKILEEKEVKRIFELMQKYDLLKFAWPGLTWHEGIGKAKDYKERVGIMVCSVGASGSDFLDTLHLSRELNQEILGAWKVLQDKKSPLGSLTPLQQKIIKVIEPTLSKFSLEPSFLKGKDLKEEGIIGRHIATKLNLIRAAQWEGKIKNREGALKYLKNLD